MTNINMTNSSSMDKTRQATQNKKTTKLIQENIKVRSGGEMVTNLYSEVRCIGITQIM